MNKSIRILYFAKLAEKLNCHEELFQLNDADMTTTTLKERLSERGLIWEELLLKPSTRCAVNQTIMNENVVLKSGDEIAFFPPVTGG